MLLIGIDRKKPVERLIRAYDDSQGLTAAFNLNMLERMKRELDGDIPVDGFRNEVRWHTDHTRIEMHLRAERKMRVHVAGEALGIDEGARFHIDISPKYNVEDGRLLISTGG